MMRCALLLLALLALLAPPAFAAGADEPLPFLWEVQGPKARHYLLGSLHLLPPAARPMPRAYEAAYDATRVLVVEADIAAMTSPEVQLRMAAATREQQPGGFKARVGKRLYDKVQKHAAALGLPTPACAEARVWFCAMTLELFPLQQARFSPEHSVEFEYYYRAREDQRTVLPLETPEYQVAVLDQMPEPLARDLLTATVDEAVAHTPAQILAMWQSGDASAFARLTERLRRDHPKLHDRLFAERNRAWAAALRERLGQDEPMLIIVGAAHLPGPDGLLALLKERGFETKPVVAVVETAPVSPE